MLFVICSPWVLNLPQILFSSRQTSIDFFPLRPPALTGAASLPPQVNQLLSVRTSPCLLELLVLWNLHVGLSRLWELSCWRTGPWLSLLDYFMPWNWGGYFSVLEARWSICAVCCVFRSPAHRAAHASENVLVRDVLFVPVCISVSLINVSFKRMTFAIDGPRCLKMS